jgi:spermidine synthase
MHDMEEFMRRMRALFTPAAWMLGLVMLPLALAGLVQADPLGWLNGKLEKDIQSEYSHIRIRRDGNLRSLIFVRDNGQEVIETLLDLNQPHRLKLEYTKYMFVSYAVQPRHQRVLIVGLGGGAMVHFLARHDPQVKVDVVEIDPAVVQAARDYFGVKSQGNVNIITADAFEYLAQSQIPYDVIYMDAFLKPSGDTDSTGVPLKLKQVQFYKSLSRTLAPDGLVVFNLNPHAGTKEDVQTIASAFPQTYVWRLPESTGFVVAGSLVRARDSITTLSRRGREADARLRADVSIAKMASGVSR